MPEQPTDTGSRAAPSTSRGLGRILVAIYAVFALSATGRSVVQLGTKFDEAPAAYLLSALAAVVYIAATVALARSTPRSRVVAWMAVLIELVGVLVIGTLTFVESQWFPDDTVWSHFGSGYGYLPTLLPFLGVAWLLHTRPRAAAR